MRKRREALGISRAAFARMVGVSVSTIRRAETAGMRHLGLPLAARIARTLGSSLTELLASDRPDSSKNRTRSNNKGRPADDRTAPKE